jgi:hypothetical protein
VKNEVDALVLGNANVRAGGSVGLHAHDRSVALVVVDSVTINKKGPFGGFLPAFGIAQATNTVSNKVRAAVEGATVTAETGDVTIMTSSVPVIVSVSFGIVSATEATTFAGSFAQNTMGTEGEVPSVDAHISARAVVQAAAAVRVTALDGGTIVAVAGHLSLATGKDPRGIESFGATVSVNKIANKHLAVV